MEMEVEGRVKLLNKCGLTQEGWECVCVSVCPLFLNTSPVKGDYEIKRYTSGK